MKKYFLEFVKKNIGFIILAVVLQMVTNLLSILIPLSYQELIDNIIGSGNYSYLKAYILFIAVVLLIYFSSDIIGNRIIIKCMIKLHKTLKTEVMSKILLSDNPKFANMDKGEFLVRIMQDIKTLLDVITEYFITTIIGIFMYVVMIIIIFRYSVFLGIVCMVMSPIFFICSNLFGKKIEQKTRMQNICTEKFMNNVDECIESRDTVKYYQCFEYQFSRYKNILDEFLHSNKKLLIQGVYTKKVFSGLSTLFPLIILILGAHLIMKGQLTIGVLVSVLSCINYVLMPATLLSNFIIGMKQFKVSYQRLQIFFEEEEVIQKPIKTELLDNQTAVKVEHLNFSYQTNTIFQDLSFAIQRNEFISIVGKNGVGKSTLIKLILGKIQADSGTIWIDGIQNTQSYIHKVRDEISPIMQNEFLFDDLVIHNILFSESEEKYQDVIDSLIGVELSHKNAGKNGSNLSGGEKQRVCIARGLNKKSNILILDEGSANCDLLHSAMIHSILEREKGNRTILVIEHGMSYLDISDRVLFIESEDKVYLEKHETLYHDNQAYRELCMKSSRGKG